MSGGTSGRLLHMAEPDAWAAAPADGAYRPASLATEGFVHCSTEAQLAGTYRRYYEGRTDLVLLEVDPARLGGAEVRWEEGSGGERFPHVYGPIPVEAVRSAVVLEPPVDPGGG